METILALINDPEQSEKYSEYCVQLAVDFGKQLEFYYTQDPVLYPLGVPDTTGQEVVEVEANLERMTNTAMHEIKKYVGRIENKRGIYPEIVYTTAVGSVPQLLKEKIAMGTVFMIITEGTKDKDNWSHTSENLDIIRQVECPVLIVPQGDVFRPFKKIVYATDYKEEDVPTLKKLIAFTGKNEPEIMALHITESENFDEKVKSTGYKDMLKEMTGYGKVSVHIMTPSEEQSTSGTIDEFAVSTGSDLIAVLKKNVNFLDRIFMSSTTNKLVRKAAKPVLVFHESE
jgi:nucleotide-binding universal stress UspA family protein